MPEQKQPEPIKTPPPPQPDPKPPVLGSEKDDREARKRGTPQKKGVASLRINLTVPQPSGRGVGVAKG